MTEIVVPLDQVRYYALPGRCALTGEPTDAFYSQRVYRSRIWVPLTVLSGLIGLVVRSLACDPVTVRVPLARRLRRRHAVYGWLSIPACVAATYLVVVALAMPSPLLAVAAAVACGAFAQLYWAYRRIHVAVWRNADIVGMRVHPALADELPGARRVTLAA